MLVVDKWKAVKGSCGKMSFRESIRDIYDVDVYEYTKHIEDGKVSFNGDIYDVEDYGTTTNFMKDTREFYILARPTQDKL